MARRDPLRRHRILIAILIGNILFGQHLAINGDHALLHFHQVTRQPNHAFDVALGRVAWIPKHHHVVALNVLQSEHVDELIDEDALLVAQGRHHAGAFHLHWPVKEEDHDDGNDYGEEEVAQPIESSRKWRSAWPARWFENGVLHIDLPV